MVQYGKGSDTSSDVSEKQIIFYAYACIEPSIIERYHLDKILMIIVKLTLGIKTMMLLVDN